MVLPFTVYTVFDLPIDSAPLLVIMLIFRGASFVVAGVSMVVARLGVASLGQPGFFTEASPP